MNYVSTSTIQKITPQELQARMEKGERVEILDVRTPAEFQALHAQPARLVPLSSLDPKAVMAERGAGDEPLYVICKAGSRASQACQQFMACGFTNVVCVEGGTEAWAAAGLPVNRGARKVLSLDRQVRIAIGAFVAAGASLGLAVHPGFTLIALFCGLGLVYAGITDTCGMAMMLARMPWNQEHKGATTCSIKAE